MKRSFSLEILAYILAVGLAAGIRLAALGKLPLSDGESILALQALDIARGQGTQVGSQPLQVLLTAAGFGLLGASNFMVRIWPALAGILLAGAPYLFRHAVGRPAALLLAFWIALDPGLVAISRQAGGPGLAVSCLALAAGFAFNRKLVAAGAFAGLALLSGPQLWPGVIAVLLAVWGVNALRRIPEFILVSDPSSNRKQAGVQFLIALLAAFGLVGTWFLKAPSGISAAASDLPAYLAGWSTGGGTWFFLPALALAFYETLAVVLGVWGAVAGLIEKRSLDRFLGLWALLALVLALAYPARQVSGLAWVLLPLLVLAARQALRLLDREVDDPLPALAQAILAFVLMIFAWMNLVAWFNSVAGADPILRAAAIIGAGVLLVLTALLMGMGWSWPAARQGLTWGTGLFLVFFTLSMTWRAAGLGSLPQADMWRSGPAVLDADLLVQTVHDLSMYNTGEPLEMEVVVAEVDAPALRWLLRDQRNTSFLLALSPALQPPLVITPLRETPELADSYRGQDFIWSQTVPWSSLREQEWAAWLVGGGIPMENSLVMLWARTDLFAGETTQPAQIVP